MKLSEKYPSTLIGILVVLTLTGCHHSIKLGAIIPSESLLAECPLLSELPDGEFETIVTAMAEDTEKYYGCRDKHKALADAWRQLSENH